MMLIELKTKDPGINEKFEHIRELLREAETEIGRIRFDLGFVAVPVEAETENADRGD